MDLYEKLLAEKRHEARLGHYAGATKPKHAYHERDLMAVGWFAVQLARWGHGA